MTGRDIFLREQAQQSAVMGTQQAQNAMMVEADIAAADAERERLYSFRDQQKKAEAARTAGITQAVTGGIAAVGEAGTAMLVSEAERIAAEEAEEKRAKDLGALIGALASSFGGIL